jgi:hypothetical protein
MRPCSKSGGVGRLRASQLAFPYDALVRLVHALYAVFKFTAALGQFLYDFIRAAGDITADGGSEPHKLTDVKFVGWHGGAFQRRKLNGMYHGKMGAGDGFAKL